MPKLFILFALSVIWLAATSGDRWIPRHSNNVEVIGPLPSKAEEAFH